MLKKSLLATLAPLAVIGFLATPAKAEIYEVIVTSPPPEPRYEVVPVDRAGYVWAPGYWNYSHSRYSWVSGHWVKDRPGYVWISENWEPHDGRWHLVRGYWGEERTLGDREWRRGDREDYDYGWDYDRENNQRYRAPNDPNHYVVNVRHNG